MRPVSLHCVAAHGTMLQVAGGGYHALVEIGRSLVGLVWFVKGIPSQHFPEFS